MIDWIKTWTFFNWLALIAFILALVGFLNSFLSLRSRYKDWRGTKSKQAFEKRLQELEVQLYLIREYRKSPAKYFTEILYRATQPLITCISSLVLFMLASSLDNSPFGDILFESLCSLLALILMMSTLNQTIRLSRLIKYVANAELLAVEVIEFVNNGKAKGLIPKNDNSMVDSLIKNNMFTENELEFIKLYVNKHLKA